MTRINLINPSHLTDKHLMVEYRGLPRIFTAVIKLQEQGKTPDDVDIPKRYVSGRGHAKFFYNKIGWLRFRYEQIRKELVYSRGYDLDESLWRSVSQNSYRIDSEWNTNYTPSPEEIYLNMARICKRSELDNVLEELKERYE